MYEGIMEAVAQEGKTPFMSLFGILDEQTDFADGLHPNTQGHEKIYWKVEQAL